MPHHKHTVGSQEVTGYLIATLHGIGEREMALEMARWEAVGATRGWRVLGA